MGHYVYKYVNKNEIIYIGKSDANLVSRINQHGADGDNIDSRYWNELNNSDIYYCELANSIMSDVVESELIRRYKPKCNKAKMSDWSGLDFPEPKWIKYNKNDFCKPEIIKDNSKYKTKLKSCITRLNTLSEKRQELLETYDLMKHIYSFLPNDWNIIQSSNYEIMIPNIDMDKETFHRVKCLIMGVDTKKSSSWYSVTTLIYHSEKKVLSFHFIKESVIELINMNISMEDVIQYTLSEICSDITKLEEKIHNTELKIKELQSDKLELLGEQL